jgi:hypothetical protein
MIDAWDGIGTGYRSMLWLVKDTQFKPVRHFEDIASPEPDGGFVYSYMSGGCADMAMHFSVWKIQNNLARMITETDVNCCVEEGEKCMVSKNKGKEMAVPADQVYLHVPDFYKEAVKSKMKME